MTQMGESGGKSSILDVLKVDLKGFVDLLDGRYESCKLSKLLAEAAESWCLHTEKARNKFCRQG